jgi:hypothetical protein
LYVGESFSFAGYGVAVRERVELCSREEERKLFPFFIIIIIEQIIWTIRFFFAKCYTTHLDKEQEEMEHKQLEWISTRPKVCEFFFITYNP